MNSKDITIFIPTIDLKLLSEDIIKLKQIFYDVIIVYDGEEKVNLATEYPYKIIWHGENRGIASARNTAVLACETEYLAFLDADCIPSESWPFKLFDYFADHKVAGAGGKVIEEVSSRPDFWRSVHMAQHWGDSVKINPQFLFGANGIYRKTALLDVGLFNEKYVCNYEDVEIARRLKDKGWKLIYDPQAIVYHRRKDNLSSLLYNFWRWNFHFYEEKSFYQDINSLISKLSDNFGRANLFIEEDFKNKRYKLLYIDFILPIALSTFDLCFFLDKASVKDVLLSPDGLATALILIEFAYKSKTQDKTTASIIKSDFLKENYILYFLLTVGSILSSRTDFLWKKILKDIMDLLKLGRAGEMLYSALLKLSSGIPCEDIQHYYPAILKDWFQEFWLKLVRFINWINGENKDVLEILNA